LDLHRAKEIFLDALERPLESRAAFVAERCGGDAQLRQRVEELLGAMEHAEIALPPPHELLGDAVASSAIGFSVGDRLGPYRLAAVLGEGGFGVVFRAEQEEPIRRTVALKVLKRSMHTREVVSRFDAERHTLARMDHPHIARVLDSGQTPDGRLYFVMEYVEGPPLTTYCEERSLSVWERLRLFHAVCLAVAHAHQKGVIHRDLKPTNILVTELDGRPVPKVIDFGVAKATLEEDESRSLLTLEGQLVGTPKYMSPEQAAGERDLDTRSDVYSLGVVLYELMVGHAPFDSERWRLERLLLAIQSDDPPRPSRALRTAGNKSTTIRIGRELDAVILRCLEKEPARRYPAVAALASDIDLYLHDRPVEAVAPSTWYRGWRLARRHKVASTSLALLLVVVIASAISNWLSLREARSQGQLATQRAADLAVATKTAQENEKRALEGAQLARRKANDVLSLSAIQELKELEDEADTLWPAHPVNVPKYEAWLTKARLLIEGRAKDEGPGKPVHPSIADHETKLAEIRARANPRTPSQLEQDRKQSPSHAEWEKERGHLQWMRRMLGGEPWPSESEAEAELAKEKPPSDANGLNDLAWPLVDTDPSKIQYGGEVKALLIAKRAVSAAKESERARFRDTLAWAYFRTARFDEARAEEQRAVAEIESTKKTEYEGYLAKLEHAIQEWSRDGGQSLRTDEATKLAARVAELERDVNEHRTYEFDDTQDRWWHTQLAELVSDLKAFTDEKRGGLYSSGTSEKHGWGIPKRAAFARAIEERTVSGPDAMRRWDEAIAAIAKNPRYGGLMLTPQIGLLPIGEDPDTHLWEFVHLQTGEIVERGADGKLALDEKMGLVFVLIPGGKFWMGAQKTDPEKPNYDPQAEDNELPVHEVELSVYFLSKYEMTQGQWERFVGRNPSFFGASNSSKDWNRDGKPWSALKPVEQVSWTDCMSVMERLGLALPSEAQWEYGCRAGSGAPFWSGVAKETLVDVGNVADAYAKAHGGQAWSVMHEAWDDGNAMTAEIGSYRPNAFGLHDVHGNVWEWCLDGYDSAFYARGPNTDPVAPLRGAAGRIGRGGSFSLAAAFARSALRPSGTPGSRSNDLGLRPAAALALSSSRLHR
jgi:serine/threonine protein kinase/formylglycine-generating enzyme required for sulfatase activity